MTIKKRIAVSFAFMLAVPLLLMMLTGLFFQLYYFGPDFPANRAEWARERRMESMHRPMPAGTIFFIAGSGLFLLVANAILSWTVSRSILRPLARLEAAACRIREGDLTPGGVVANDNGTDSPDEFERVAASFEEMRKRLQAALLERIAEEENRREMIASISHDLRTPIAAIKGYVEGIRDGIANTPEKRERYLDIIRSKAELMDRLVDDLSLYSGFETGSLTLVKSPMDLGLLLKEVLAELAFDYPGLDIVTDTFAKLSLDCDAAQFRRVVTNIVQNAALHASPCTLRVSVKVDEPAVSDASGEADGGMATIVFADDGPGIAGGDLGRIFERFFRADKSRNQKTGGHGLGLSIARMIVEAHGGRISAESTLGKGTRIIIKLPLEGIRNG